MPEPATLVLIHGHGVDASIWDGIYADLALETSVLTPDFARLTNHTTIEAYAEDLLARLQAAQLDKVLLVGHSMGGYMALAFAERCPDYVQGLCLFHSTAYADDEAKKEQRQQVIQKLDASGGRSFLETAITNMFAAENQPKMQQTIVQLIDRYSELPKDALLAGIQAILSRPDRTHVIQQATFPVSIVAGRYDQLVPLEKSQKLAEVVPNVNLTILEHSGHLGMVEEPEASLDALRSFVRSV
ncbi:alpha/beta fold hydrolase [Spirosoma soli]|uniref:Alpha/beta fold hydrolase n=1 Tax=Spirosoma soli TaxID=1770529 RepID=A0ABW5M2A0_9BACT